MTPDRQRPSGVERALQGLLDLIETDRARQCDRILGEAREQAQVLRAQAHADARARMRRTFEEQRARRRERLAAAEAGLATVRRLHEQQRLAAWLKLATERLPHELEALWRHDAARAAWARAVLAAARSRLPPGRWRIAHAPDWPAEEREAVLREAALDAHASREADARIAAGLKVVSGPVVLDGTLEGLLADRVDVEARLVASRDAS